MANDFVPCCACGCGQATRRYVKTVRKKSRIRGSYAKFLPGHNAYTGPPSTRFWMRVGVCEHGRSCPQCCWLWQGAIQTTKYGTLMYQHKQVFAHRLAWELHYGPIPAGLRICHHCDHPPCVNPAHLFCGTAKDNSQDAVRKGRLRPPCSPPGVKNPNAKLTTSQVHAIRTQYRAGDTISALARHFQVSRSCISDVVRYKHYPEEFL